MSTRFCRLMIVSEIKSKLHRIFFCLICFISLDKMGTLHLIQWQPSSTLAQDLTLLSTSVASPWCGSLSVWTGITRVDIFGTYYWGFNIRFPSLGQCRATTTTTGWQKMEMKLVQHHCPSWQYIQMDLTGIVSDSQLLFNWPGWTVDSKAGLTLLSLLVLWGKYQTLTNAVYLFSTFYLYFMFKLQTVSSLSTTIEIRTKMDIM